MSISIRFQLFTTPRSKYIYDSYTNSVFAIPEDMYMELEVIKENRLEISNMESAAICALQGSGVLLPYEISEISHPHTSLLPHIHDSMVEGITLQVTQGCNLRCGYCVYGEAYFNRSHSAKRMDLDTAIKAIDFLLAHNSDSDRVAIAFYGGEPLLEFKLIKECVAYTKQKITGKKVILSITTNGTLMSEEIMQFFVDNNFNVLISLDGDQESHDANRKFPNGRGSFDMIMANVRRFKELYPDYVASNVSFNTVINTKTNVMCLDELFAVDDILSEAHTYINEVSQNNLLDPELVSFSEQFRIKRRFENLKLRMSLIGRIDDSHVSRLTMNTKRYYRDLYNNLNSHLPMPKRIHPNGPCVPGQSRLFVSTEGVFYPCERVPESEEYAIGDIHSGLDPCRASAIMNVGKVSEEECKDCWAIRLCQTCVIDFDYTDPTRRRSCKLAHCVRKQDAALAAVIEMTMMTELGYKQPMEERR